jgi:hypothetical protein
MLFDFSYNPGTSQEQITAFEMAGEIWSSFLTDNVTVNIHVEMTKDLPTNVIGGALPAIEADYKYRDFRKNLEDDRTSWDDYFANDNLLGKDKFSAAIKGNGKDDLVKDISVISMTSANAKALDIVANNNYLDGYILMSDRTNSSIKWNYDVFDNSVPTNTIDFLSVAVHEIGHVLGFVSGVDDPGFLTAVVDSKNTGKKIDGKKLKYTTVLDMYRYSSSSASNGMTDLSLNGENKYFSIDGGWTGIANFATGKEKSLGADGEQASHWKHQSNPVGIMDPILDPGQRRQISNIDRRAMDVIGWDVRNPGQLNWQTLYNRAVNGAKTAWVANRDSDVQAMVDRSQVYEWGSGQRRWQKSFWQHILDQEIGLSDTDSQAKYVFVPQSNLAESYTSDWSSRNDIFDDISDKKESENNLESDRPQETVKKADANEDRIVIVSYDRDNLFKNSGDRDSLFIDNLKQTFSKEDALLNLLGVWVADN